MGVECLRLLLYKLSQRGVQALNALSTASTRRERADRGSHVRHILRPPSPLDVSHIALAIGCGLGLAQIVFFQWSTVGLSLYSGVYYSQACPQYSMNFVLATLAYSFSIMHATGTVFFFYQLDKKKYSQASMVPVMHIGAATLMVSFVYGTYI